MNKHRFQDLDIWEESVKIGNILFDIADKLEENKLYRFSEKLHGAAMSISNNITEGSGSTSKNKFGHFFNIARHSTLENANILLIFNNRNLINTESIRISS